MKKLLGKIICLLALCAVAGSLLAGCDSGSKTPANVSRRSSGRSSSESSQSRPRASTPENDADTSLLDDDDVPAAGWDSGPDGKTFDADGYTVSYKVANTEETIERLGDGLMTLLYQDKQLDDAYRFLFIQVEKVEKDGEEQNPLVETMRNIPINQLLFFIDGEEYSTNTSITNENDQMYWYLLVVPKETSDDAFVGITYEPKAEESSCAA